MNSVLKVVYSGILLLGMSGYALEIRGFVPDRTVVYKTVDGIELTLHIFNPPDLKEGDRCPAAVFFYGGGWFDGSQSQFHAQCRYLASRGMVACSADYRVKARHRTTPYESVKDSRSAVRWMRSHAQELCIDPNRIAAGGGSAGGQLAAMLGNETDCDEATDDLSVSARANALILFNPPTDMLSQNYADKRSGSRDEWRKISPLHTLAKNTPPMILFHGINDSAVPVEESKIYKENADKLGVFCELHLYPKRNHGFFNYIGNKKDFNSTMIKTDRFLMGLGWLSGEPTLDLYPLEPDVEEGASDKNS